MDIRYFMVVLRLSGSLLVKFITLDDVLHKEDGHPMLKVSQ